jgi:branched-chain amino acid aminotransferase
MVDGRTIGEGVPGPMVSKLQQLYRALVQRDLAFRAGNRLA